MYGMVSPIPGSGSRGVPLFTPSTQYENFCFLILKFCWPRSFGSRGAICVCIWDSYIMLGINYDLVIISFGNYI